MTTQLYDEDLKPSGTLTFWHPSTGLPPGMASRMARVCEMAQKTQRELNHRVTMVAQEIDENIAHVWSEDQDIEDAFDENGTTFDIAKGTVHVAVTRTFFGEDDTTAAVFGHADECVVREGPSYTFPIRWLELETAAWMAEYEADHSLLKVEPGENL